MGKNENVEQKDTQSMIQQRLRNNHDLTMKLLQNDSAATAQEWSSDCYAMAK
jgi:hypothetical protein